MKKFKSILFYSITLTIVVALFITINNTKKNIDNKSDQIDFLEKNLKNKKDQIKNIHSKLLEKNINIENLIFEDGIIFENKIIKDYKIKNNNYVLEEFSSKDIIFAKHPEASSSSYIDYYDKKIFLVTATGQITYTNFSNFNEKKILFESIQSNIQDIIKYKEFYNSSAFGIKDILINNKTIYVSYIKEHKKDCYSTSILHGELNYNFIFFEEFYSPLKCINKKDPFYNSSKHDKMVVHQSGGRILIIDNKLVFTTGEYRLRTLAQNISSDFGKIISIDLENKSKNILSLGHRNPQGLYFSNKLKSIFSTEHGPNGGDEINMFKYNNKDEDKIPNFGWPIASYGRHYFDNQDDNDPRYKLSPLKKSHSKNGFKEPLKYFVPSVGISQIIGIPKKFYNSDNDNFLVGTMGNAKKFSEGMISLYFFEFDKFQNKIINSEFIPIKSRVRDMIYVEDHNLVMLYLENNNSIGFFKKKN
tara:strand:+ start:355 stop:1776 length:1422 start_codon:yes stop_codon:yes gene_type:complete